MLGHSALSEAPLSALPAASGSTDVTVTPGAGSLTLTGYAPTVTATSNATVTPGAGALVLTGYAPTVTVPTSVTVTPGTGSLTITGYAPTVTAGGQPSQDFRNVLDGPGERYWLDKKKREKADRKKREDERLAALEIELRQAEADAAAGKKPKARKATKTELPDPLTELVTEPAIKPPRAALKPKVIETPELIRAKADAVEAVAVAQAQAEALQRQYDEEAAIILLLAA